MKFIDNPNRKVYNVDLDGTLTNGEKFWEELPTVNKEMKRKVRDLYAGGNIIIIWTGRQWEMANETVGWLIANKIPFHGIFMGKGGSDCYIDDRSIRPDEILDSNRSCYE